MTRAATTARRATRTDVPLLIRMLGRAFFDDPLAVWAYRSPARRRAMLGSVHRARLHQLLAHNEIWITSEASSAALWVPPGQWQTNIFQDAYLARGLLDPRLLISVPKLALALRSIQRKHPRSPSHWYLSLLGTDPDVQGRGLGSAVLQPVLEICDRDNVGAYLESSHERNLAFYARQGFRAVAELHVPRGPDVWMMWREPQTRQ